MLEAEEHESWSTAHRRRAFVAALPLFLFGLCVELLHCGWILLRQTPGIRCA